MLCCDYDAIVHYPAGEFASRFADDMKEKLEPVGRDKLERWEVESFLGGQYETYISRKPIVMYRVYGKYLKETSGAKLRGRFVSTEFSESMIDAKLRLALKPEWKNTKMYEAKLIVPEGTRLNIGIVAPIQLPSGELLPGGAPQIMLPENWPDDWVQGYRRISGRQLQIEPKYWPEKPEETTAEKGFLYPECCPRCCYHRIRRLRTDEQFTVIGSKGGKYLMKKQCLNPECLYYW